jgi:hypothetical protein
MRERLRPNISVVVDRVISQEKLRQKLEENSEAQFIPSISAG